MSRENFNSLSASEEEPVLFFVYGTLKRGYGNNRILGRSEYMGSATTKDTAFLLDYGCPVLIFHDEGKPVRGEVFKVTDDATCYRLDCLEGYPRGYDRKEVTVILNGEETTAWVYFQYDVYEGGQISNRTVDGAFVWEREYAEY